VDKKVTIADIARLAGVSHMTVSRVLNEKGLVARNTEERVRKVIEEVGYQPNLIARSLTSKQSMLIGVSIPRTESIMDEYIAQVLSGVLTIIKDNNYRVMLFLVDIEREKDTLYVDIIRRNMIDGLLLFKTKVDDPKLSVLAKSGRSFVLINHKKIDEEYNFIDTRNEQGAQIAVKYLYELGHRDIAFVAGSLNETNARDRLEGFKNAMSDLGLPCRENCIVYGEFNRDKAYNEVGKLLALENRPSAIFCSDDYMAIAAMKRIEEAGLAVPKDIAVIGFDNIELSAHVQPELTTIQQPLQELGTRSMELLLDLINGRQKTPIHQFLDVKLVKRQSC
jgi:DNA-binding LacI/PurR family transcriptional regulator